MDLVFAACDKHMPSSGLGEKCKIHVAYNHQAGLCTTQGSQFLPGGQLRCRGYEELCSSDPHFEFNFWTSDRNDVSGPWFRKLIFRTSSQFLSRSCSPVNTFSSC